MKKTSLFVGLAILLASSAASAVPATMNFTGRLSTSSGPVDGSVSVQFRLFDVATGGTQLWTETHSLTADAGLVYAELGALTSLDQSLLNGNKMYLEITVGTETLTPRMSINAVPYSLRTDNAETLGGTITAADVVTTAAGTNGITATKTGNALSVSLTTSGCTTGQVYKFNGSGFACANDDSGGSPTAGAGIAVSGNTISLSTTGCAAGYVWKWSGAAWACALDSDTPPTAGAGIAVSGNTVGLSTTGCVAGDVWKWSGTAWSCDPDSGGAPVAGAGIAVSGNTVSLSTSGCVAGDVWKWNGASWSCDPDAVGAGGGGTTTSFTSLNNSSVTIGTTDTPLGIGTRTFTKLNAGSRVRLSLHARLSSGTWSGVNFLYYELRIDGTAPLAGHTHVFFATGTTEYVDLTGVWTGLAAGSHTVTIVGRTNAGTASGVSTDPGGFSGTIIVEEY